jgi:predicted MPP superfamily phosphohydrolase
MKLTCISDLHFEYNLNSYQGNSEDFLQFLPDIHNDILVLAGDIDDHPGKRLEDFLSFCSNIYNKVFYVPGNHEYYTVVKNNSSIDDYNEQYRSICDRTNVVFIQQTSVIYNGIMFLGCTLWTDIDSLGFLIMNDGAQAFYNTHSNFTDTHHKHRKWLTDQLSKIDMPTVVITHHPPTLRINYPLLTPRKLMGLSTGYATNLEHLFKYPMILWCAGHVHIHGHGKINDIPYIVNPLGFPFDITVSEFNRNL